MTELHIRLPIPPNRANARGHWAKQRRQRQTYIGRVMAEIAKLAPRGILPAEPMFRRGRLSATFHVWLRYDADNLVALLKWPIDGLIAGRLLPDDGPAYLELGTVEQVIDRKNRHLDLVFEPVE